MTCCSTLCKGKGFKYDLGFTTNILTQLKPTLLQRNGGGSFLNSPKKCVRAWVCARVCVCVGEEGGYLY